MARTNAGQSDAPQMKGHRWFAALYDSLTRRMERKVLGQFRVHIAGGAAGRVLEIGAGTGANFPYYKAAEKVVATEPDPFMLQRARKRAQELGLDVELHQRPSEGLPFPDHSFESVVSTLVLCSVADQARALAEVKRVLKPGGSLRFIEHVRAPGLMGRLQDLVTPVWRWFGAGCHPNRDTARSIQSAGFEIVQIQQRPLPFIPLIVGVARPA